MYYIDYMMINTSNNNTEVNNMKQFNEKPEDIRNSKWCRMETQRILATEIAKLIDMIDMGKMPQLVGVSEKQISYASSIRDRMLKSIRSEIEQLGVNESEIDITENLLTNLMTVTSASFWLDNYFDNVYSLYVDLMKNRHHSKWFVKQAEVDND